MVASGKRHGRATSPPGRGGQCDRPVEVGAHQGQPVGGMQEQGVQLSFFLAELIVIYDDAK